MRTFKLSKDERGAILPLVALVMFLFLFGFAALVIDAGLLYSEKRVMVTAADAAALAGAQIMEDSLGKSSSEIVTIKEEAIRVAEIIAKENGVDDINNIDVEIKYCSKFKRDVIEVKVFNNKKSIFAKFLGIDRTNVAASAIGTWGYAKSIEGGQMIPLFVFDKEYVVGEKNLHDGKIIIEGKESSANRGFVFIGQPGIPMIEDALSGIKTRNDIVLNNIMDSEPGQVNSIINSLELRMRSAAALPDDGSREKYMRGIVPIVAYPPVSQQGNKLKLQIIEFAVYQIEDVITEYRNSENKGYGSIYKNLDKIDREPSNENIRNLKTSYSDYQVSYEENGVTKYTDVIYSRGTIIGEFTGDKVELRAIMMVDDQNSDNTNILTPKYHKLIE